MEDSAVEGGGGFDVSDGPIVDGRGSKDGTSLRLTSFTEAELWAVLAKIESKNEKRRMSEPVGLLSAARATCPRALRRGGQEGGWSPGGRDGLPYG